MGCFSSVGGRFIIHEVPELPDVEVYRESLQRVAVGRRLVRLSLRSPFLLRTVAPPPSFAEGKDFVGVRRLGKRLVLELEGELFLVLHLMIAGRLRWKPRDRPGGGRNLLATFELPHGVLVLTEAGSKKRASLHLVVGEEKLALHDPGGLEVVGASIEELAAALHRENHTLKRALTDPRLLSGIGNSYSDEILHRARLSPFKLTSRLARGELERLHAAIQSCLSEWTERLRREVGDGFPDRVTAFRPGMAVHGRYRQPCPMCGDPVQRLVYADNESNYCPTCQTGGKLLADRALSRLLKDDWPKTLEELELRMETGRGGA